MRRAIALLCLGGALALPAQALAFEEEVIVTEDPPADSRNAGCRTVDVARVGKSVLGFTVYKFHHVKRWCWDYPRVTRSTSSAYISNVDPNWDYKGVISATGGYYTWCCGVVTSGHQALRQGRVDNCPLFVLPCIRREYPWVKIWGRGDGTYTKQTGL